MRKHSASHEYVFALKSIRQTNDTRTHTKGPSALNYNVKEFSQQHRQLQVKFMAFIVLAQELNFVFLAV